MIYQDYVHEIKTTLDKISGESVERVVDLLHDARQNERTVYVFGNGGSAATAMHLACDLNKNTRATPHPPFRVMSLCDNMPLVSACANDEGYHNSFACQLYNFVRPNDVVLAISASGNSANVIEAIKLANASGAHTVGWCGYDGGQLAPLVDISLVVPNDCIEQIEDIHLMIGHIITASLRKKVVDCTFEFRKPTFSLTN